MLVGAVAAALLVPSFGLTGGGIALLLSTIAIVLGGLWMMHRAVRERPSSIPVEELG
jgi:O-antigen/teichoic acid export membrane protein